MTDLQFYIKSNPMKSLLFLLILFFLILSCSKDTEKNKLLEAEIVGQIYSFNGIADKYTDYVSGLKSGYGVGITEFNRVFS